MSAGPTDFLKELWSQRGLHNMNNSDFEVAMHLLLKYDADIINDKQLCLLPAAALECDADLLQRPVVA